jgi:U3 small nucleolar RNA-associated protein 19
VTLCVNTVPIADNTQLLDAELGRELKKPPVVEFEIPKRIFSASDNEMGPFGELMEKVMELN